MIYSLGDLIELETDVNSDLKYGLQDIVGVTITKQIIPTIANLKETSLEKFIIVKPYSFIYNPRTHGKKIGLGYNNSSNIYIATWNNVVFKIKDSMKNIILSDYLYLYFNRDIWDKEACFNSWGSSTVVLNWESFCDMKINLPNITKQHQVVEQHKVISQRINILSDKNELLEKIASDYYKKFMNSHNYSIKTIDDFGKVVTGKTPSMKVLEYYNSKDIPFIKTPDMHDNIYVVNYEDYLSSKGADSQKNKYLPKNTLIMSCIGSAGVLALTSELSQTNQQINAVLCNYPYYLYFTLKNARDDILILGDGSTTMANINKTDFGKFQIRVLDDEDDLSFINSKLERIFDNILENTLEMKQLNQVLKSIVITI